MRYLQEEDELTIATGFLTPLIRGVLFSELNSKPFVLSTYGPGLGLAPSTFESIFMHIALARLFWVAVAEQRGKGGKHSDGTFLPNIHANPQTL